MTFSGKIMVRGNDEVLGRKAQRLASGKRMASLVTVRPTSGLF